MSRRLKDLTIELRSLVTYALTIFLIHVETWTFRKEPCFKIKTYIMLGHSGMFILFKS